MTRTYTKGKRAEQEAEPRERITEAALALHTEIGPAATTVSMIEANTTQPVHPASAPLDEMGGGTCVLAIAPLLS